MNKASVHQITDTIGSEAICSLLNVSHHSVRYARTTGEFPASWYGPLKVACDEIGIPCPLSAFNWKSPAKNVGDAAGAVQDAAVQIVNGGVA